MACERYVEQTRDKKGGMAAADIKARFVRWIYSEAKFGAVELGKLNRTRVEAWRRALMKMPVRVSYDKENPTTRERSASTVNRDISGLRAALNFAHDSGWVTSDMAWRVALRPTENAGGRRDVYLDRDQRRMLIAKAQPDVARFLTGMALLPLRPGALAALTVRQFDSRLGVLSVGEDKTGRDRQLKLPPTTAQFFEAQCKDKTPGAPLFARADGKAWDRHAWKDLVKAAAAAAAGMPSGTVAYTLRHSVITDLVAEGLPTLTVAQLSGTSIAMIERHYGHLRADHAAAALAGLAL